MQVLRDKVQVLEHQVTRLQYSTSTDPEGARIIDYANHVSFDDFLPVSATPLVYQLDLEDDVLKMPCEKEVDTQLEFNAGQANDP